VDGHEDDVTELLNKEDREDDQAVVEDGHRIIYLSFLTRRTQRTTRQLPNIEMRIIYLNFLKVPSSQIGSA
jgi:hypothetical protein